MIVEFIIIIMMMIITLSYCVSVLAFLFLKRFQFSGYWLALAFSLGS